MVPVPEMSIATIRDRKSDIALQEGIPDYIDNDCLQNKKEKN